MTTAHDGVSGVTGSRLDSLAGTVLIAAPALAESCVCNGGDTPLLFLLPGGGTETLLRYASFGNCPWQSHLD